MTAAYHVPATAAVADKVDVGEDALVKIDQFLAGREQTDELDPRVIALETGVAESQVRRALDEYVVQGVLSTEEVVRCSVDQTSAEAALVNEARSDGDVFPCPGGCERDLAADRDAEELTVYLPKHRLPKLPE